ncbi:hypothetical protein MASR2M41_13950 [Flammeovirgaceae bacterium]
MQTVVKVEGLSKAYRIGKELKKSDTIASALWSGIVAPFQNFRNLSNLRNTNRDADTLFWALKDINFEVKEGEVLGIIGHNGAGKSTLLKILSRITEPTEGRVSIHGRVSSLLEVGTGFHPDLTGRENIYMNGTILGMRKREIDAKLDEIIEFGGITKHIDTPVKRYSSGMTVRLAFSVAAHLEPEILIIDEVLAVGDAEFQKKCLGKMDDVAKQGRTVLFVSHKMAAVSKLCQRGIVLRSGSIEFDGFQDQAIENYLKKKEYNVVHLSSNGFNLKNFIVEHNGRGIQTGSEIILKGTIEGACTNEIPLLIFTINSIVGERVVLVSSRIEKIAIPTFSSALEFNIKLANLNLIPNRYNISLSLLSKGGGVIAEWREFMDLDIIENVKLAGLSLPSQRDRGYVYCESDWFIISH